MVESSPMTPGNRQLVTRTLAASIGLAAFAASAGEVQSVKLVNGATGTRAEIQLAGSGGYKTLSLAGPNRLVIDFPDSAAARRLSLPQATGVVTAVRTGQPTPGTFRVVFDLSDSVKPFKPQMQAAGGNSTLVIEWPGEVAAGPMLAASTSSMPAPAVVNPANVKADAARATAALTSSVQRAAIAPPPQQAAASQASASDASALPQAQSSLPPQTTSVASQPVATQPVETGTVGATPSVVQPQTRQTVPTTIATGVPTPRPNSAAAAYSQAGAAPVRTTVVPPRGTTAATGAAAILNGGRVVPSGSAVPATAVAQQAQAAAVIPPRPVMPSEAGRVKMRSGMRPLIVAIDPGHGGQDPGAMGPSGKREKDVTLAIGRELARQINATPGMKAYMTRDTDVFIPLPLRAQKARAAKADIFISVHADAAENRSATGSSVYVLSTKGASSQRARWLADKENAADLVGGVRLQQTESTLANVLLDLAQSGHMKASEDAAGQVLGGLKRIGNNHKPNLERANFAVLRTSDMPAMLVETAFISNPDEERRLIDPSYQRRIAGAVLDGVNTFFTRQPPPGTLFAARAQAEADAAAGTVAGGSR